MRSAGDRATLDVRFLSNIDGAAFDDAVKPLDPGDDSGRRRVEDLHHARNADQHRGGARLAARGRRGRSGRARDRRHRQSRSGASTQGIDETRILQFGEGVGGRYSLWSSVGLSAALALGWDAFEELLEGAAEMDRHFRFAEPAENVPLIAAFADRFYVEERGCQTRGVFAYDERLRLLPFYLQQLEMELNGKSVTTDGKPVEHPTAPVTWGGTGTDAQHAVFQLLHQGTVLVPGRIRRGRARLTISQDPEHHRLLLLNAFAQGAALMQGRPERRSAAQLSGQPAEHDDPARPARSRARSAR